MFRYFVIPGLLGSAVAVAFALLMAWKAAL